ncbi:acyltransferase family protein [Glaciibacter flavus]|uniref:acyltransferase family protein n=1 Tax=Orlajensenia flava TaxID=2565934 RepID=UPI003B000872
MQSSRWIEVEQRPRAWVNFAKGVAIVLVVLYHVTLYLQHEGILGLPNRIKLVLELFPMPVFFLIAGLFGARAVTWSLRNLWMRRLWPVLYLYLVWSVIRFLFYLAVPGLSGEIGELPASHPLSLALVLIWPSSGYWFIYALAVFAFAAWAMRVLPGWLHVLIAAIISTAFTAGLLNTHNVGWNRVGALYVFYVFGALYARQVFGAVSRVSVPRTFATAAVLVAVSAVLLLLPARWLPFLVLVGQASAVVLGVLLSAYLVKLRPLRFVSTLGAESLQIYLLHLFIIVPSAALIGLAVGGVSRPVGVAMQFALVAAAIALSLLLSRLTTRVRWLYVPPTRLARRRRQPDEPKAVPQAQ